MLRIEYEVKTAKHNSSIEWSYVESLKVVLMERAFYY